MTTTTTRTYRMLDQLSQSLPGILAFFLYFAVAIADLLLFKLAYTALTPHDEWKLVKDNNTAAAVALAGALVGYALALGSAAANSLHLLDFALWAIIAFAAQLLAFGLARLFVPQLPQRISEGQMATGVISAGFSLAVGLLNSACMTY